MSSPSPDELLCHRFTVEEADAPNRLDAYLTESLSELSRSRIQQLIKKGNVHIGEDAITRPSYTIEEGNVISLVIPEPEPTTMQPADIPLDIIFEDESMLVVNKPAGLTVHPGAGCYQDTLANALLAHCGDNLSGIGGVARPGIVHRLDKDTTGLMLVAKTDQAHMRLSEQIAERTVKRIYHAIIWGTPAATRGTIHTQIGRSRSDRTKMTVLTSGGKEATTYYQVTDRFCKGLVSAVDCKLETGRTHQIRVHLTHEGHPLLGDQTYRHATTRTLHRLPEPLQHAIKPYLTRQALHARKIGFYHPISGEYMEYEAPLPDDMKQLKTILEQASI